MIEKIKHKTKQMCYSFKIETRKREMKKQFNLTINSFSKIDNPFHKWGDENYW